MPYIHQSSYSGNSFFKGKHIETIIPALFRSIPVNYERERLHLADTDFIDLDWIKSNNSRLLILLHGLEGSSNSQYIKGMAQYFSSIGWDICAVNFRTCSGEMNTLLKSYHSGATQDVDEIIQHIIKLNKYTTLCAAGFSLGGNVLLKYLGERVYKIPSQLKAAIAFSVPCDLGASSKEMDKLSNRVYMIRFLNSLRKKMIHKSEQFKNTINIEHINRIKTFEEFDNKYTAPINGFKDAQDYYAQCNSLQFLSNIQIPTLLVNALNDPFLTPTCFPKNLSTAHSSFFLETPEYGGHVGFSEGLPNQNYWSEKRAHAFISSVCD